MPSIVDYYIAKLASIYRSQPKASATVGLFVKQALADGLALQLGAAFDLDLAYGDQLDTIGKYVGVSRDVGTPDFRPYFGFVDYNYPAGDQNLNGFTSYASLSLNASGRWLKYAMKALSMSQLSDFQYIQLIKLKILTNSSFNTVSAIQDEIATFFAGQLHLRDNKNMTMTYFYGSSFQLPTTVLAGNLPRPMGVGIEIFTDIGFDVTMDGTPVFNSASVNPQVVLDDNPVQFVLTNVQTLPFTITEIDITEPDFTIFDISPALPVTLNQGDSLSFKISF